MYISDVISDECQQWKPGDIIIIHAQTGAGKTFFVLDKLLPFLKGEGKRLLYLANRTALRDQVELSYQEEYEDNIWTMTYQKFEKINLNGYHISDRAQDILSYDFWIMDESHYFLSDATFNDNVLQSLNNIRNHGKERVLIFMTATVEYLLLCLGKMDFFKTPLPMACFDIAGLDFNRSYNYYKSPHPYNLIAQLSSLTNLFTYKELPDHMRDLYEIYAQPNAFQEKFAEYIHYFENVKREVFYYSAGAGYDYVKPRYFDNIQQLAEKIKRTHLSEKWMIFVSSKNAGEEIQEKLLENGIESVMITADTKKQKHSKRTRKIREYQVYRYIIEKEKSPERVTISTSVLDNGINLKDSQLKHMAILEMNSTTFLQMLGRKRITQRGETLYLYIQKKNIKAVTTYFCLRTLKYVKFLAELQFISKAARNTDLRRVDRSDTDDLSYIQKRNVNLTIYKFAQTYQINGNFKPEYSHYVKNMKGSLSRDWSIDNRVRNYNTVTAILFEPNPYTSVRLGYDYYRMLALLEQYENLSEEEKRIKKESLWIEHQLSWLGLQYDPACWIDYEQHIKAKKIISTILARRSGNVLSCTVQGWLKRAVQQAVLTSHPPLKVKIGAASLKKVNEALIELGYDKQIKSKNRSINGVQRNYWTVIPVGDDQ